MNGQTPAPQIGVVDDVVVDEGRRVNELDDRGVEDGAFALIAAQARRHQQDGGPDPLAAARLDVLADLRNQVDLRLDVPAEFAIDVLEVGADGLEDLREGERRFLHGVAARLYHGPNNV